MSEKTTAERISKLNQARAAYLQMLTRHLPEDLNPKLREA